MSGVPDRESVVEGVVVDSTPDSTVADPRSEVLPERVAKYAKRSRSANTQRAYTSDWVKWEAWCRSMRRSALPAHPVDVATFISEAADATKADGTLAYSVATLSRWVASIGFAHSQAGYPRPGLDPVVSNVLSGIRRERAETSARPLRRQAKPLMLGELKRTLDGVPVDGWPMGVIGYRDRAILLTGWAGALRSDSVVGLNVADLTWHPDDGVWIRLRRSKTDQEGKGRNIAVPRGRHMVTCAPCALTRWVRLLLAAEGAREAGEAQRPAVMRALFEVREQKQHVCLIAPVGLDQAPVGGPLFRSVHKTGSVGEGRLSPEVINHVVGRRAAAVGLSGFTSHSMRAGFVTEASRQGLSTEMIMRQTGQTKDTVEIYRRHQQPLEGNAVTHLGL